MNIEKQIEAILFFKGEPMNKKAIAKALNCEEVEIVYGIEKLRESLKDRGVCVIERENEISLGTSPDMSDIITSIRKEELSRDIGKAGLETLSIILYKGPISRSEIDYIRGVNSSFIIRNLLIRGLVERDTNPTDSRSFLYKPTLELLSTLGITQIDELPEYHNVIEELQNFVDTEEEQTPDSFAEQITQE